MINDLSKEIYENNKAKGFYDEPRSTGDVISLIHSELSEALESDRKGITFPKGEYSRTIKNILEIEDDREFESMFKSIVKDTYEDELADTIIRLLDHLGFKGIDVESHVLAKVRFNKMRPYKHGKKY